MSFKGPARSGTHGLISNQEVRVRVLWDKQHETHIVRKSTLRSGKISRLVSMGPISNKIQLFKNLTICQEIRGLPHTPSERLIYFLVIFESLNSCTSFNIGPINTKLENIVNLAFLFLILRVACCLSHNKTDSYPDP